MVAIKGTLRVYDFIPEELELVYYALKWYCAWCPDVTDEQKQLAEQINKAIEVYLRN